jgi:hypothetical protein
LEAIWQIIDIALISKISVNLTVSKMNYMIGLVKTSKYECFESYNSFINRIKTSATIARSRLSRDSQIGIKITDFGRFGIGRATDGVKNLSLATVAQFGRATDS